MDEVYEYRSHPILGKLAWIPKYSYWSTQQILPDGHQLDIQINPGDRDRFEFLPHATVLFQCAMLRERFFFRQALQTYLLELYNNGWRQEEDPVLSEDEFAAQLTWGLLTVSDSDIVPIEFWYDDGDNELFGGHSIVIQLTSRLQYRSAHLAG